MVEKGFPKPSDMSTAELWLDKRKPWSALLYQFFLMRFTKIYKNKAIFPLMHLIFICFAFCVYNLNLTKQD
jgi:hypothetical protein